MRLWVFGLLCVLAFGMMGAVSADALVNNDNTVDPSLDETLVGPGLDLNSSGRLKLEEDFTYQMSDTVNLTMMKGGKLDVKVENGVFKEATFNLKVQVEIQIKGQALKLKGTISGKYDADYDIDFTGRLKVEEDFTHEFGDNIKATLKKGGRLDVKVEKSKFEWATLENLKVQVEISLPGKTIELEGSVTEGKYDSDYNIDFTGRLKVKEDFTYQASDNVKVTLVKGGRLTLKVEESKFDKATFENLKVQVEIQIKGQALKLKGTISGKYDADYDIDFTGRLKVEEDFTYTKDPVTATLKQGGKLTIKVEESKFEFAKLEGFKVNVDVKIGDDTLKLEGSVDGKIDGSYKIDLNGSIRIREPFVYDKDKVKVTMNSGKVTLKVEKSKFEKATLEVKADVEIAIGEGSPLKLKGSVSGSVNGAYKTDFSGELKVKEDFTYQAGDSVTLTLRKGGRLNVTVQQSEFKKATFDARVHVEIKISNGSTLKLKGSISGSIDGAYKTDFSGELKVKEDFSYQPSDSVKVTLVKGGRLTLKVEQSEFEEATFENLEVLVDVKINNGSPLKLKGSISGSIDEDYKTDFSGELKVKEDFTYQARDNTTVTLKKGEKLTVRIENGEYREGAGNRRDVVEGELER